MLDQSLEPPTLDYVLLRKKKMLYSNCVNVYFNDSLLILVWILKEGERYMIWDNNKKLTMK